MSDLKVCTKCKVAKDVADFGRDSRAKSGLQARCKACRTAAAKEDYYANLDARKEARRQWRLKNKDKKREQSRAWAAANPGRQQEIARDWRARNPERHRAMVRRAQSKRRARLRECAVYVISERDYRRILAQGCSIAGCQNKDLHLDHIIPLARGGSHGVGNLQALCRFHNISKHDRLWIEYRVYLSSKSPRGETLR